MRLTGLFTGREAMVSEGAALATVADNLANLNTTGFKSTRSNFENILADSQGSLYGSDLESGNGVRVQDLQVRHDKQGTINFTDRSLDTAIDGNGFFVLSDGTSQFYTRAGNFSIDQAGTLVTDDNLSVMGFTDASPETAVALSAASVTGTATASATGAISGNVDTSAPLNPLPPDATSFATLNAGADFSTPITVIDSLGASHDVSLYFFHDATNPLVYTVQAYVGSDQTTAGGLPAGTDPTPVSIGSTTLTFQSDGTQGGAASSLALSATWGNGAAATAVTVDTSKLTGFASPSALDSVTMDGNRAGSPTGYEIAEDGTFNVVLDNGDSVKIGQIVLGTVPNVQGMERIGDNRFRAGDEAGDVDIGVAGTEGRGSFVNQALENSNVDPSQEFVDLVRYQRAYQAGSQIVTTMSEILQTTIQLA